MNELRRTVHLGPVAVGLHTDQPRVLSYLDDFYAITSETSGEQTWTVDAQLGNGSGMCRNPWGVAYVADERARVLRLRAVTVLGLAKTARKAIREALVVYCEERGYVMLHASAFTRAGQLRVVVGDKGSGKTTLALTATIRHGARYVSNDHLLLYPALTQGGDAGKLMITSLPTPIPVKVGTFLDLEDRLPPPSDDEGVDLDLFRAMPAVRRYRHEVRVLYSYRRLGQDNPVQVPLGDPGGPDAAIVLARYANPDEPTGEPTAVLDPETALWPHVRFDWPFDPMLNTQHLPRPQRDRHTYAADAHRLLAALTDRAPVFSWAHRGDPQPLLHPLGDPS